MNQKSTGSGAANRRLGMKLEKNFPGVLEGLHEEILAKCARSFFLLANQRQ